LKVETHNARLLHAAKQKTVQGIDKEVTTVDNSVHESYSIENEN